MSSHVASMTVDSIHFSASRIQRDTNVYGGVRNGLDLLWRLQGDL